jgi:predicted nucleotidyltransferase
MDKHILNCDDALRVIKDSSLRNLHAELIHLGLVRFDSGYANMMVGLQIGDVIKSKDLLNSFTEYCKANPDLRFWQALRNWSEFSFIYVSDIYKEDENLKDTFYFENKKQ